LVRGTGLAGDRVAVDPHGARGTVLVRHDLLEDLGDRGGGLWRHRPTDDSARRLGALAVADDGADEVRRDELAAVRARSQGGDHLERRDADVIPHRDGGERAVLERRQLSIDETGALMRNVARVGLAEAEAADVAADHFGAELEADADGADVAGSDEDVREAD